MDTVGTYKYKKWTICGKNDYNKEWFLEPNFLLEMFSDKDETFLINFINAVNLIFSNLSYFSYY